MIDTIKYIWREGVPLEKIGRMVLNPAMSWRYLWGPKPVSSVDGLVRLCEVTPTEAASFQDEYRNGSSLFWGEIDDRFIKVRGRKPNWRVWSEFLYMIVRAHKPQVMIETGPFDGQSTAIILLAMHKNELGKLVSVDLPARESQPGATHKMTEPTLPAGQPSAWLVPDWLRSRFVLEIGDSREILPGLLSRLGSCDIFFHDSLHTYAHMLFEYSTAWPHLSKGGLLVSDDILWSDAYRDFCSAQQSPYIMVGGFGATKK